MERVQYLVGALLGTRARSRRETEGAVKRYLTMMSILGQEKNTTAAGVSEKSVVCPASSGF